MPEPDLCADRPLFWRTDDPDTDSTDTDVSSALWAYAIIPFGPASDYRPLAIVFQGFPFAFLSLMILLMVLSVTALEAER